MRLLCIRESMSIWLSWLSCLPKSSPSGRELRTRKNKWKTSEGPVWHPSSLKAGPGLTRYDVRIMKS
jgi:hypothetical protein